MITIDNALFSLHCYHAVNSMKTATDTHECDCYPINLYLQRQAEGWIWPIGSILLTPGLDY